MLETHPKLTATDLRLGLSGNLCRCTGYESIIKAGIEADVSQHRRVDALFPPANLLTEMKSLAAEPVRVGEGDKIFFKPTTIEQAIEFRAKNPGCTIIAGGTDLGVVMNKGKLSPSVVMSLQGIVELRHSSADETSITFGALVSLAEMETICQAALPEMSRLLRRHGSPPIRNAGTLAGNIANGSPIGDTMPGLFVLNAEVELTGTGGKRSVDINQFYTGYRRTVMKPDELITAVRIPLPASDETYRLIKISKRYDLDISTFSAAFWMRGRERIEAIRIAYGGVGPVILRLHKTEQLLTGQTITDDLIDEAAEMVRSEITPISDVRGGQDYRLLLGENVLRKFFAEVTGSISKDTDGRSPFSSFSPHPSSFGSNGDTH
jgi:xanthine dehydrogenase small subunit